MKTNLLILLLLMSSNLIGQSLKVDINAYPQSDDQFVLEVKVDEQSLNALNWQGGTLLDPALQSGTPILKLGAPQLYQLRENIALNGQLSATINVTPLSWEDIMEARYFASYIIKRENEFDQRLQDYLSGIDILYEGEKIKNEIFNLE